MDIQLFKNIPQSGIVERRDLISCPPTCLRASRQNSKWLCQREASIPRNGVRKIGMTIAQKTRGDTYVGLGKVIHPTGIWTQEEFPGIPAPLVNKPVTKMEAFDSELEADGRIVSIIKGRFKAQLQVVMWSLIFK